MKKSGNKNGNLLILFLEMNSCEEQMMKTGRLFLLQKISVNMFRLIIS